MDTLYIIIPAYNEEANIETVINDWYPIVEQYGDNSKLVVIDDGSRDATYSIISEMSKNLPNLISITKNNSGHGSTILYGYHYAIEHGADYIFQTDSDGQTLPSEFNEFWENRLDYDMIIGWRNHRKDGFQRILVTKVLKYVLKFCFKETIIDANTPFRLISTASLKEHISLVPDNFNLSNVIISVIYQKKCTVKYIPITFRPRQGGTNSINMKRIFKIGIQAMKDFRYISKNI